MLQEIFKSHQDNNYTDVSNLGGKASNLIALQKITKNIPKFIVFKHNFFKQLMPSNLYLIDRSLDFDEFFKKIVEIHPSLEGKVIEQVSSSFNEQRTRFAIRSSANLEDSKLNSFAGIFNSFLNIDKDRIYYHIMLCWFSMYSDHSVEYMASRQLSSDKLEMNVIVQVMLNPSSSGVVFTKNPVTNQKEIMIEAVFGLGELLVNGQVTPDNYILNTIGDKIIGKQISFQHIYLACLDEGLLEKKMSENKGGLQKISDEKILELAQLTNEIKEKSGYDVDIEFCIEKGVIFILQVRPITI